MGPRVAFLSVHACPLVQPGAGWSGGMNVYLDELARALAREGVRVDLYTRRHSLEAPATVVVEKGFVVHHVEAGPPQELSPDRTLRYLGVYTDAVYDHLKHVGDFSMIHSHYWLSGWAGLRIKSATGLAHVHSFHSLGRVKDANRRLGSARSSLHRLATEEEMIVGSDRIIVSSEQEKLDLVAHYGANPSHVCVAAPGVDHSLFMPGLKSAARMRLGWPDVPTLLYVGRIQALKGTDVAVRAFELIANRVESSRLVTVGAPSGRDGRRELEYLEQRVKEADLSSRVIFAEPVPHRELPDVYRASDLLLVPSRSESFGLVAAEAQASGTPVLVANKGGLPFVAPDDEGGLVIDGLEPSIWADAAERVLTDPALSLRLSTRGPEIAEQFSWNLAVERIIEIYQGAR